MDFLKPNLLLLLTLLPTVAAVLLILAQKFAGAGEEGMRRIALGSTVVIFLLSLPLIGWYDDPALTMNLPWIDAIGARFHLGVDGMSLWLVLLTTLTMPIAVLSGWTSVEKRVREYLVFMLLLETGMIGVFVSMDMILFYLFWEVVLVPMYFLIGVWGGERRIYAAVKFFLYTVVGSLLMLAAMISLYFIHGKATGNYTFDIVVLTKALGSSSILTLETQKWLFLAFALAFMIKVPLFPLHTWLPDAHVEAPTAGSVILAAVLLKMGTYGLMRFNLPLFPEASHYYATPIFVLAVIGIVYGALVAMVQPDVKKLVAYSSVSHLGFVVLGIFSFTDKGLEGALYQMLNHGVSTGALFLFIGFIYERRHTRQISEFGGLATPMPVYSTLFVITCLASAGLPLLNGFVGEFLILLGAFFSTQHVAFTAIAATGMILSAVYLLWMLQRVVFGEVTNPKNAKLQDLNTRELVVIAPLIILMVVMGVAPNLFLDRSHKAVEEVRKVVDKTPAAPAPVESQPTHLGATH
ncbi:MAG: NADH-quinone oxidoreductase subunit M [Blastocatellia bacterium]|nr:NADH-quinone oxidoreductase subunit M [Blastocatellia bacterium]